MAKVTRSARRWTARHADKFALYESSVQDPPNDIRFVERLFRQSGQASPRWLREDFCGTAKLCAAWAASHPERHAIGIDLDEPTLAYGRATHLLPLAETGQRVELLCQDVRDPIDRRVDVAVAFNFSYCVFKERTQLVQYAKGVRKHLRSGGMFVLDIHGGPESLAELEESTKHIGFTYVWDQDGYDPINGYVKRSIHFRFPDGTGLKRAFTYDWRLWSLPELRDVLYDAGFSQVDVYWEGSDQEGRGNGVFRKAQKTKDELAWIAYLVACK